MIIVLEKSWWRDKYSHQKNSLTPPFYSNPEEFAVNKFYQQGGLVSKEGQFQSSFHSKVWELRAQL